MTRINSGIDPSELCDQHLLAEYREIGRIGALLRKRLQSKDPMKGKPPKFTLGTGHMLFFIDKGEYIRRRFLRIRQEMEGRGFAANLKWRNHWNDCPELNNDWEPDSVVRSIVSNRIKERMPRVPRMTKR